MGEGIVIAAFDCIDGDEFGACGLSGDRKVDVAVKLAGEKPDILILAVGE